MFDTLFWGAPCKSHFDSVDDDHDDKHVIFTPKKNQIDQLGFPIMTPKTTATSWSSSPKSDIISSSPESNNEAKRNKLSKRSSTHDRFESMESIEVTPDSVYIDTASSNNESLRNHRKISIDHSIKTANSILLNHDGSSDTIMDNGFSRSSSTSNDDRTKFLKRRISRSVRREDNQEDNIQNEQLKEYIYEVIRDEILNDKAIKMKLLNKFMKESMEEMKIHKNSDSHYDKDAGDEDIENQKKDENKSQTGGPNPSLKLSHRSRRSHSGGLFPWDIPSHDYTTTSRQLHLNNQYTSNNDDKTNISFFRRIRGLENDTFTLMMLSTNYGLAWFFLFCLFLVQACLLMGILIELVLSRDDGKDEITRPLDVPIVNTLFVTIGQGLAIIFATFSQRDLLEGMNVFIALFRYRNWSQLNELPNGLKVRSSDRLFWFEKVFLSYAMKLSISLLTLFTAMVLILQSTDLIDLLKDFTALFIVASLDNFVYSSIGDGYFGHWFDVELQRKEKIKIQADTRFAFCLCKKVPLQSFFFALLLSLMLTVYGYVTYMQTSGAYFFEAYPKCTAFESDNGNVRKLKFEYWGDGVCDPRLYTQSCGNDNVDCNYYCMTKWLVPSQTLWKNVNDTLSRERTDSCQLFIPEDGYGFILNGTLNGTDFDSSGLYELFAKCFSASSIFNEGNHSALGLFCLFGDFTQEISDRG